MLIDVYPSPLGFPRAELAGRTAIVIDVLRATSAMITALANGAKDVIPVLSPEEAAQRTAGWPRETYLLGGERNSVLIPGFDLGNSPLEYTPAVVRGKSLVITTTNGTRAIRECDAAEETFLAAMLNVSAVADAALAAGRPLTILAAGTHDRYDACDVAVAGAIIAALEGRIELELNDLALTARELYRAYRDRIADLFAATQHGRNLLEIGLGDDITFCAQANRYPLVPLYRSGSVALKPS